MARGAGKPGGLGWFDPAFGADIKIQKLGWMVGNDGRRIASAPFPVSLPVCITRCTSHSKNKSRRLNGNKGMIEGQKKSRMCDLGLTHAIIVAIHGDAEERSGTKVHISICMLS